MLRYSVDNEVLFDIYNNYQLMEAKKIETYHLLGDHYRTLTKGLPLNEKTELLLESLCNISDKDEAEALENKIIHGYISAKMDRRQETDDFDRMCNNFDQSTQQALEGLKKHVVGKKVIPYKIRNKVFHIDVVNNPGMIMQLDFENALVADGRHPKNIYMTHISGDKLDSYYSLEFVNGLIEDNYPTKGNAFIFDSVRGSTKLYNYSTYQMPIDIKENKVQWRLLFQGFEAVIAKINILGMKSLNEDEKAALPLICVFYELIRFYLEEDTIPGIGKNLITFSSEKAEAFAFSETDITQVCEILKDYDLSDFCIKLKDSLKDIQEFCLYWIAFASSKKAETLYRILKQMISACGSSYSTHPFPLSCRKYHVVVRRRINEAILKRKWSGQFPCYRKEIEPQFLEVSNVYSKMYTYINEKNKVYYVDFLESVTDEQYVITAVVGFVLLRDREKATDYCAVRGYFTDGGRRNVCIADQIVINNTMDSNQVEHLVDDMMDNVYKNVQTIR